MGASDDSIRRAGASRWVVASVALIAALCAACSSGVNTPRDLAEPAQLGPAHPQLHGRLCPVGWRHAPAPACASPSTPSTRRGPRGGPGADGAPGQLCPAQCPRAALRRRQRGAGGPGPRPLPRTVRRRSTAARSRRPSRRSSPPGSATDYSEVNQEWIGAVDNGLDADYQWMYFDGPDSGVPQCSGSQTSGCWVDRQIVLDRFGSGSPRDGRRLGPLGRHFTRRSWRVIAGRNSGHGVSRRRRNLRVHLEGGAGGHGGRDAPAAPLIPSSESDTGIPDPPPTSNRSPTTPGSARRTGWTIRPRASMPSWRPSTAPTLSKASAPWCCRSISAISACPTSCSLR